MPCVRRYLNPSENLTGDFTLLPVTLALSQ
jgi:hypothetical protein